MNRDPQAVDSYVAPSDGQLLRLGMVLGEKIQSCIVQNRLAGYEDLPGWEFEVQGHTALVDKEGFTRSDSILVVPTEGSDDSTPANVRRFRVLSDRSRQSDRGFRADVYTVDVIKNTQLVSGVWRATLDNHFLDHSMEKSAISLDELFDSPLAILTAIKKQDEAVDDFKNDVLAQNGLGAANSAETAELIELLERCIPSI